MSNCEPAECFPISSRCLATTAKSYTFLMRKSMQRSNAEAFAISFMVRDVEPYLERNLKAIIALGEEFRRYWLFFVENDSRDRTQAILQQYVHKYPDVLRGSFLGNISRGYSVALCPAKMRNCVARINLLAKLRQHAFDLAWAQPGWDALIMLDFDFAGFSRREYLQMFVLGLRLNASATVGVSMYFNSRGHCAQYDRSLVGHAGHDLTRTMTGKGCMGGIMNGHSGFPTLYAKALRAATPTPRYANHTPRAVAGGGYNDLLPFNMELGEWGRSAGMPMLVDPRFRPVYSYGEGDAYMRNRTLANLMNTKPDER